MNSWRQTTIGDLVSLKRGYDLTKDERSGGNIPVMGAAGENGFHNVAKVKGPGIVLGRSGGSFGKAHFIEVNFWPHNTAMYVTDFKGNDPYFLFYLFRNIDFKNFNSGSAQPSLNRNYVYPIKVIAPDVKEQREIGSTLKNIDSKIEINNRINAELEAMVKTIYDYWFVQFDFPISAKLAAQMGKPELEGKPYKSSGGEMVWNDKLKRKVPKGWLQGTAKNIFDFNPTMRLSKGSASGYIDMSALPTSGFMTNAVESKAYNGGVKFQNGDVLIARITPCLENGKTALVTLLDTDEIGFGSTEFIVIRGKKRSLSGFSACLSRSDRFRKYAIMNMTGTSGRKRVDAKFLMKYPMAVPSADLLEKFEALVAPFFQKMTANTKENQELASLRDWLLPMLMNGQVKVAEAKEYLPKIGETVGMAAAERERYI